MPEERIRKGRLKFDGRSDESTFVICDITGDNKNQKLAAKGICEALFSGSEPQPFVGWWRRQSDGSSSTKHGSNSWRPKAIISVTGGAALFKVADAAKISSGILKAAHAFKAMIVTGGSSQGIMKMVGDAVESDGDRIATLGIFPYGGLHVDTDTEPDYKPPKELDSERHVGPYEMRTKDARLDGNHHFFALIDEGSRDEKAWGKEIPSRSAIEYLLSELPESGNDEVPPVLPHVLLVVDGGVGTLETALQLSEMKEAEDHKKKVIPIVVVEGTGRVADVLATTWKLEHATKPKGKGDAAEKKAAEKQAELQKVLDKLCEDLVKGDAAKAKQIKDDAKKICGREETVTIYNFDDPHSLEYAVMRSICRGTLVRTKQDNGTFITIPLTPTEQLRLVLGWKDADGEVIDMAKKEILLHYAADLRDSSDHQKSLTQLLIQGLKRNKVRFVEMLLDFDVRLPDAKKMKELYTTRHEKDDSAVFKKMSRKEALHDEILTRMINITKTRQLGSYLYLDSRPEGRETLDPNAILNAFLGWRLFTPFEDETTREHLFLWCILTGRKEMAELFWRKCHPDLRQHSISRALFACAIARTLGPRMLPRHAGMFVSADEGSESQDLASRFESIAREILDQCYKKSPRDTVLALTCPLLHPSQYIWVDQLFKRWPEYRYNEKFLLPLTLAFDAEAEAFVEHEAFQECLDRIWYGRLVTRREELRMGHAREVEGFRVHTIGLFSRLFRNALEESKEALIAIDIMLQALLVFPAAFISDDSNKRDSKQSSALRRMLAFYSAPVVKFYLDFASYFCFLILYTFVGLHMDYEYTPLEGVVHAWIVSLGIIEFRDWFKFGKRYSKSISNFFDLAILFFYIPAAVLRIYERAHFNPGSFQTLGGGNWTDVDNHAGQLLQQDTLAVYPVPGEDFIKARSWHGMAGIFFWIRITDFFRVSRTLGPLMLVLMRVFWDAFQFFVILLIFIVSFGAAIICAGRPRYDQSISMAKYVEQIVFLPYIMIFGEHFMDGFPLSMDNYPLCDLATQECSTNAKLGIILVCIYLFISTILLMNLLIAMMNSSYSAVLSKSTRAWKFQRLEFVLSYSLKSILPLPLAMFAWAAEPLFDRAMKGDGSTAEKPGPFIHRRKDLLKQYCALELELKLLQQETNPTAADSDPCVKEKPAALQSELAFIAEGRPVTPQDVDLSAGSPTPPPGVKTLARQRALVFEKVNEKLGQADSLHLKSPSKAAADTADIQHLKSLLEPKKAAEGLKWALKDFAQGNTVGEILYRQNEMMASLYQDVYLEDWWLQNYLEHYVPAEHATPQQPDNKEKRRADLMRRCVNMVTSVSLKWISEHGLAVSTGKV